MKTQPDLTVRGLRSRAALVPLRLPLHTSGGVIHTAPMVLIDLHTHQGVTGSTYLFCYTPLALKPVIEMLDQLLPLILDQPLVPLALEARLQRAFRLLGAKGVVGMALAGLDMAAWDALTRAQGLPLARLLGAEPRPLPAYNSCGLGIMDAPRAAAEATRLLERGFRAIKLRLGYADAATDRAVVRAVRQAVGEGVTLMSDYNQALSVAEAVERLQWLADEGLHWVEEPTLAHDYAGHATLRAKARVRIQMGENWWGPHEMAQCLAAGASDLCMPDAMKIGGVSGWMRAAALADSAGLPMSSHLFPEVSAHLLAATPTCHWLEYVDWADPLLLEPLRIEAGQAVVPQRAGSGIEWDEARIKTLQLH